MSLFRPPGPPKKHYAPMAEPEDVPSAAGVNWAQLTLRVALLGGLGMGLVILGELAGSDDDLYLPLMILGWGVVLFAAGFYGLVALVHHMAERHKR